MFCIEQPAAIQAVQQTDEFILGYPIYHSNLPKIMQDFLTMNQKLFTNKKVFFISGNGSGWGAKILKRMGATILGGCHIKMPDCIGDEKVLKKSLADNQKLVKHYVD